MPNVYGCECQTKCEPYANWDCDSFGNQICKSNAYPKSNTNTCRQSPCQTKCEPDYDKNEVGCDECGKPTCEVGFSHLLDGKTCRKVLCEFEAHSCRDGETCEESPKKFNSAFDGYYRCLPSKNGTQLTTTIAPDNRSLSTTVPDHSQEVPLATTTHVINSTSSQENSITTAEIGDWNTPGNSSNYLAPSDSSPQKASRNDTPLSAGAIVAIVIVCLAAVILFTLVFYKTRRQTRLELNSQPSQTMSGVERSSVSFENPVFETNTTN